MVQGSTFGMNPELIRIDVRIAWEFASCYGVNLAFSVVGLGFFLQALTRFVFKMVRRYFRDEPRIDSH
jgi:hypothetical protein